MLVRQINEGRAEVENQYIRAVTREGNLKRAQAEVAEIFELRDALRVARARLACRIARCSFAEAYADFDAERRFGLRDAPAADNPACECGAILRGVKKPRDCKLFGTVCTPRRRWARAWSRSEGACAAHWTYGRFRESAKAPAAAERSRVTP